MSTDNNYQEILEEVCEKLSNMDSVKEMDVINIKSSVESIENLITDTQAKLNFQEIKEKLENISFQVGSCNEALLKSLYNDINALKNTTNTVGESLETIKNAQNLALTTAEFEEFQKQQLDLVIRTNENIYNELNAIKENGNYDVNPGNLKKLEEQLADLHKSLAGYITQLVSRVASGPNLDEIGAVVADLNSVQQKSIHQTNLMIKGLQDRFDALDVNLKNQDFETQIAKISEIYDSLNMINSWIEKVGYINQAIENVYSRLGESIDFDEVADKVDIIYENVSALNTWMNKIDDINRSIPEVQAKISTLGEFIEDAKNINETINAIKDKLDSHIPDDFDLDDISGKMDIVYENLTTLNDWASKLDKVSVDVSEIKEEINTDSMKSTLLASKIDDVSEQITEVSKSISETAKSEEVSLKLNVISEQITGLHNEIADDFQKDEIAFKLEELSSSIKDLNKSIDKSDKNDNEVSQKLGDISEQVNGIIIDIDNLPKNTAINNVSEKVDNISNSIEEINETLDDSQILSKIDIIYDNISLLNEWIDKIDNIKVQNENLDNKYTVSNENLNRKINEISETLANANKIVEDVPNIKDKLDELSGELLVITGFGAGDGDSSVYSLLNIEADFLNLKKVLEDNAQNTAEEINHIKERFSELNNDISSISIRTNKLILSADDANKEFKLYLESFKNTIEILKDQSNRFNPEMKFAILGEKITDMVVMLQNSINANRNLNNAFMYLAEWVDATGGILNSLQTDLTDIKVNSVQNALDISENIKNTSSEVSSVLARLNELEEVVAEIKTEDLSELKSLLTGIIVQLNTALTPEIDSLNEKIDKLSDENEKRIARLENLILEKTAEQTKNISELEAKFTLLDSKFDRILEVINDNTTHYEMKDILNYMATQISGVNESLSANTSYSNEMINKLSLRLDEFDNKINNVISKVEKNKENTDVINEISKKLETFDNGINKIVSYIEED